VRVAPRRRPGETAEQLVDAFKTLTHRSGIVTRDRAAAYERAEQRRLDDERRGKVMALRAQAGVFKRYERAALDDVDYPQSVLPPDEFNRYLQVRGELASLLDVPGILVLSGDNGPGKTHLASAAVNGFCDAGRRAYYCRAIDFYRQLKSTFGQPGRTAEDLVRRFETYELLVIDEIEVRSESAWENNELRSLLDARYARCVATVLITNKTAAELNGNGEGTTPYLSRALRDRIRHGGSILECRWRSLRAAAGEVTHS